MTVRVNPISANLRSQGDRKDRPTRTNLSPHPTLQVDRQGQPYYRRPPITRVFDAQHRIV